MIFRKLFSELELPPGDEVVAVVPYMDVLIVVTKRGAIFQVDPDRHG